MREVTATEAARRFSELLDAVEHRGESFRISRKGRVIARIDPARPGTGAAVLEVLRTHPVDEEWARELRELRDSLVIQERDWPD